MEDALVHDAQQAVQNGRVGLKNFIQEYELGLREVALRLPLVYVVLELLE